MMNSTRSDHFSRWPPAQLDTLICNMRCWRPSWKMAAVAARGRTNDGRISKSAYNTFIGLWAKFGASVTKQKTGLIVFSQSAPQ